MEDEESVRQAVERALRREGFAVTGFADYPDPGLVLAAAPDLAVLDVLLPSGNGFELARKLRAARDLPIVFLTARDAVEDRLGGFELVGTIVIPLKAPAVALAGTNVEDQAAAEVARLRDRHQVA